MSDKIQYLLKLMVISWYSGLFEPLKHYRYLRVKFNVGVLTVRRHSCFAKLQKVQCKSSVIIRVGIHYVPTAHLGSIQIDTI